MNLGKAELGPDKQVLTCVNNLHICSFDLTKENVDFPICLCLTILNAF